MKRNARPMTGGVHHITMGSSSGRAALARAAGRLIGAALYVVGGWLFLSRLFAGGNGPIDQRAPDTPSAHSMRPDTFGSIHGQAVPPAVGGATGLRVLIVSVLDGATYNCLVPVHLVSAHAVLITSHEFDDFWRKYDCS